MSVGAPDGQRICPKLAEQLNMYHSVLKQSTCRKTERSSLSPIKQGSLFREYANQNGPVCVASQTGPFFSYGVLLISFLRQHGTKIILKTMDEGHTGPRLFLFPDYILSHKTARNRPSVWMKRFTTRTALRSGLAGVYVPGSFSCFFYTGPAPRFRKRRSPHFCRKRAKHALEASLGQEPYSALQAATQRPAEANSGGLAAAAFFVLCVNF